MTPRGQELGALRDDDGMVSQLFKPHHLRQRQCIATTTRGVPCRANISEGCLHIASELLGTTSTSSEKGINQKDMVRLLVCESHRARLDSLRDSLVQKYRTDFDAFIRSYKRLEKKRPRPYLRHNRIEFQDKLQGVVSEQQWRFGHLYIFTSPYMPGFVKVGCAKTVAADRVKQWRKCYPDAVEAYSISINFPQRIEELIHLQLAKRRYDIPCSLKSCKAEYHDEWFSSSVEEAKLVVNDYETLLKKHELYDPETGLLTSFWVEVLTVLPTDTKENMDARVLLQGAEMLELSKALEVAHISPVCRS